MNDTQTETNDKIFLLTIYLVTVTVLCEAGILFGLFDKAVPQVLVGRILGWFEGASMMAIVYWVGSSHGSRMKDNK